MTAEQWAQLKEWFGEALAADSDTERAAVVERARRAAPELAGELASLLAAHAGTGPTTIELAPQPLAWPERYPEGVPAGTEIGRYRVVRELGRGGAGLVLLAERSDDEFHRPVALKLLRFRAAEGESGLKWERGSLARMQHGNIATLLDWGTGDNGAGWLATEYIDGQPMDAYCREAGLGEAAILGLFAQVTAAVAYAHERAVLHLDLKPGNILVRGDGVVKLLDFGIAQMTDGGAEATAVHRYTPGFASPEQQRGEAVGAASDVYALGTLLGRLLPAKVHPQLAAIVQHATEEQASKRYATVAAMAEDLQRYQQRRPIAGVRCGWGQRAGLYARRRRQPLAWTGVVAVVAAGAALLAWRGEGGSERPVPAMIFPQLSVHQASDRLPLRVNWPSATDVRAVAVVTGGVANLDFTSADASACTGHFAAGASCVMHIVFAPTTGGTRLGAVVFRDAQGREVNTQYLVGLGDQEPLWTPPTLPPLRTYSELSFARGLSTDEMGNAYFEEARHGTVDEIPADLGPLRVVARMQLESGATAVDGAGHLYFSSSANHAIYELEAGGPVLIATVPPTVLLDNNLSVDAGGNLYTSGIKGDIYMVAAGTRRVEQLYPPGQGHRFVAMASDPSGNLYCLDYLSNTLFELLDGSRHLQVEAAPDGHMRQPHALALLYSGDVLVGNDEPGERVWRYVEAHGPAQELPVPGNQGLAMYHQSRLYAVVDNYKVVVYPMGESEKH